MTQYCPIVRRRSLGLSAMGGLADTPFATLTTQEWRLYRRERESETSPVSVGSRFRAAKTG